MKKKYAAVVVLMIIMLLMSTGCQQVVTDERIENGSELIVHYIDVWQGDAILIQAPGGKTMLIDAGENEMGEVVLQYIMNQGIEKIDYIIGTHPHSDHIGGLDVVIDSLGVGEVYLPKVTHTTETFKDVLTSVKNKGLKVKTAKAGIQLDMGAGISAEMLSPNMTEYKDLNNYSPIMKITYGETSFLFTGDAEKQAEEEVLEKGYNVRSDILKVGHHGSVTSTSDAFLAAVSPRYAVISVGKDNQHGHPHQEILEKLKQAGVQIFRTDEMGSVVVKSSGKNLTIQGDKQGITMRGNTEKQDEQQKTPPSPNIENAVQIQEHNGQGVEIISIDLEEELVTIQNAGLQDVDMTGWRLVSVEGNQEFIFPEQFMINAGTQITIASGSSKGDLQWSEKKVNIWNNSGDKGELYDSKGNLVSKK
ncbi:MAG: MBL fold metallo-hydrolase [Bacillota bacterium]